MNAKQLVGVFASCVAVAVVSSGCSDDGSPDSGPAADAIVDSGVTDPVDMGVGGTTDTGGFMDATVIIPDLGFPDAGFAAQEGEACATDLAEPCADGLACVNFGDFLVCLNVCQQDSDCANSQISPPSNICANEGRLTANDGTQFGWCVQELVGEGELVLDPPDPSVNVTGNRLTACDDTTASFRINDTQTRCILTCNDSTDCAGSVVTPPATTCGGGVCVQTVVGEGESAQITATEIQGCAEGLNRFAGQDNNTDCAKTCESDADCTTAGINVCNINNGTFTSTAIPGVCTRGPGNVGDPCSQRHVVDGCTFDNDNQGLVLCRNFFGLLGDTNQFDGVCTQFCGNLDGSDITPPDACQLPPTRPDDPNPVCITTLDNGDPLFGAPDVGICGDPCTLFPNSCGGTEPQQCFSNQAGGNFTITYTQCIDVVEPVLPAWYRALGQPTAAYDCADRFNQCPADSFCQQVSATQSVCIFGCDPTLPAAEAGCDGKSTVDLAGQPVTNMVCNAIDVNDPAAGGLCEAQ